jgi:hypothetical protein
MNRHERRAAEAQKRKPEDKQIADDLVRADIKAAAAQLREMNIPTVPLTYDDALPPGDGEGEMIHMTIGVRGLLTRQKARENAEGWRKVTRQRPKGMFVISMLGYDQDPREIWEIPEAAEYVCWWAKDAGMDDPQEADRWLGDVGGSSAGMGFLAGCGAFGEELKHEALRFVSPTRRQ